MTSPLTAEFPPADLAPDVDAARPLALDIAIDTHPPDARRACAQAVGDHIAQQLRHGRSLFNVLHDGAVRECLGADGRALPACARIGADA